MNPLNLTVFRAFSGLQPGPVPWCLLGEQLINKIVNVIAIAILQRVLSLVTFILLLFLLANAISFRQA